MIKYNYKSNIISMEKKDWITYIKILLATLLIVAFVKILFFPKFLFWHLLLLFGTLPISIIVTVLTKVKIRTLDFIQMFFILLITFVTTSFIILVLEEIVGW